MSTQIITTIFQFKRGLAERWTLLNPILNPGEPGFELDTDKFKIGDGETAWNDLPYQGGTVDVDNITIEFVNGILGVKAISTDLLTQGQNVLILSGGSSTENI